MSSDIPAPTPDPHVEDSWFQRPAFLATCALIIVLVGAILWFIGRESASSADPTTVPVATVPGDQPETTASDPASTPAATAEASTTPTTLVNPFGDVPGTEVVEPASPPALFATSVQQAGDPAAVAALHSPAYYYALWSLLADRSADPAARPVATAAGYSVNLVGGPVELVDLAPADGPVRTGAELRGGVVTAFVDGIQSTGVCQPDVEPQCDLSGTNFAPDSRGSGAQMWALAKVVLDPATDTWLLYVDLHGPRVQSATVDSSVHVGLDPVLNIVAVTYTKSPPPGTVLTLVATADDGSTSSFDFAVS